MSAVFGGFPSTPALRLFDPHDASDAPLRPIDACSPEMRLPDFVEAYFVPVPCRAKDLSKATIDMYRAVASFWSELTRDRPLAEIGVDDGADFLQGLRLQPGLEDEFMAPATVARHAKNLQRILDCAGPASRHGKWGRYGVGLIDVVPFIEPPEVPPKLPDGDFTLAEVLAILAKAPTAKLHEDYAGDPGEFWVALVKFLCYTGLRIRETMELRWDHIDRQILLIPDVIAKTKRSRMKYLHAEALAAIEPLRGLGPRIFNMPGWPAAGAVRWLQRRREQLVIAAELSEHRRFGFHGFRKYHATQLFTLEEEGGGSAAAAAQSSLGHGSEDVTLGFYVNHNVQLKRDIELQRSAIDRLPQLG